ncbi:MAG: T9SS type A sorting domain-containing protein [bacterium]
MLKRALFIVFIFTFSAFSQDTRVKYIGNTLHVINSDGFFRQIGPKQFKKITFDNQNLPIHILSVNDSTGYIARGSMFYKTTNSGADWILLKTFTGTISSIVAKQNYVHLLCNGWLHSSSDYGNSWTFKSITTSGVIVSDLTLTAFRMPNNLYMSAMSSNFVRISLTSELPYNVWYQASSNLIYVDFFSSTFGYNQTSGFEITTDGGKTWTQLSSTWNAKAVCVLDSANIYIGTNYFDIVKINDMGLSYTYLTNCNSTPITISACKSSIAYTNSISKSAFVSSDGGFSWTALNPISMLTSVEDDIQTPTNFALYNNYPNPFNPTTLIKFTIPERNNVTITVYNLLGKEIAILTNKVFEAGTHEVVFNALNINSELSNGVYFYTMQYGKNIQTKKMILIK